MPDPDLTSIATSPAGVGILSAVATQGLNWLIGRRKARAEIVTAERRVEIDARSAEMLERNMAFQAVVQVVETLRKDVSSMRAEIEDERRKRHDAEGQVERMRNALEGAEVEIRSLRREIGALRVQLQKHGVAVPPDVVSAG